jgi:hypothetical protein
MEEYRPLKNKAVKDFDKFSRQGQDLVIGMALKSRL